MLASKGINMDENKLAITNFLRKYYHKDSRRTTAFR